MPSRHALVQESSESDSESSEVLSTPGRVSRVPALATQAPSSSGSSSESESESSSDDEHMHNMPHTQAIGLMDSGSEDASSTSSSDSGSDDNAASAMDGPRSGVESESESDGSVASSQYSPLPPPHNKITLSAHTAPVPFDNPPEQKQQQQQQKRQQRKRPVPVSAPAPAPVAAPQAPQKESPVLTVQDIRDTLEWGAKSYQVCEALECRINSRQIPYNRSTRTMHDRLLRLNMFWMTLEFFNHKLVERFPLVVKCLQEVFNLSQMTTKDIKLVLHLKKQYVLQFCFTDTDGTAFEAATEAQFGPHTEAKDAWLHVGAVETTGAAADTGALSPENLATYKRLRAKMYVDMTKINRQLRKLGKVKQVQNPSTKTLKKLAKMEKQVTAYVDEKHSLEKFCVRATKHLNTHVYKVLPKVNEKMLIKYLLGPNPPKPVAAAASSSSGSSKSRKKRKTSWLSDTSSEQSSNSDDEEMPQTSVTPSRKRLRDLSHLKSISLASLASGCGLPKQEFDSIVSGEHATVRKFFAKYSN